MSDGATSHAPGVALHLPSVCSSCGMSLRRFIDDMLQVRHAPSPRETLNIKPKTLKPWNPELPRRDAASFDCARLGALCFGVAAGSVSSCHVSQVPP